MFPNDAFFSSSNSLATTTTAFSKRLGLLFCFFLFLLVASSFRGGGWLSSPLPLFDHRFISVVFDTETEIKVSSYCPPLEVYIGCE